MIFQNNFNYLKKRLCYFKGGGGDSFDAAYNKRMATIAEPQQGMAEDYFNFYKHGTGGNYETQTYGKNGKQERQVWVPDGTTNGFQDMEQAQIDANMAMIPHQTAADINQIGYDNAVTDANRSLLPQQTQFAADTMTDQTTAMRERAPVRSEFYKQSAEGVDVESRANRAAADASHAFMNSDSATRRSSARMGVNPNSGRFASMQNANSLSRAKAIGSAKTTARTGAEQENFGRLESAMGGTT